MQISESISEEADEEINARGLTLFPGAIDIHVHFRVPGGEYKEDFTTGSIAAASGGITTALHMPNTVPPITTAEQVEIFSLKARQDSVIDVRCYIGATTDNIAQILAAGDMACGIKVAPYFTGADGRRLIDDKDSLRELFELKQSLPIVIHCEQEDDITANELKYKDSSGWTLHGLIRSREATIKAVKNIIDLAQETQAAVHITHISTEEEVELIRVAKAAGCNLTCDVTPHHLAFTEADLETQGWRLKVNPPLRLESDRQALWRGLESGVIDIIATDHAPHTKAEKDLSDYWTVPPGVPGVETMLPFLLDHITPGFSLERMVECTSTNPAKRFGILNKGKLEAHAIADLVLVDRAKPRLFNAAAIRSKCGWSPWENHEFSSVIHTVIENGQIIRL